MMMTAPLVSAEVDLRDFSYMALDVVRLRDSNFAAMSTGDGFRAAVLLWCAAWHQVPAASLPTDDRLLANLSGYGRDVAGWKLVREEALHGFILCDDGRLYHATIAEKAKESWQAKLDRRARTKAASDARAKRDGDRGGDRHVPRNDVQGNGEERKGKEESSSLRSDVGASAENAPEPAEPRKTPEGPKAADRPTPRSELTAAIGADLAGEIVDHRAGLKKPLTVAAAGRLAQKFVETGSPQDAARMMIDHAWQGFEVSWFANATAPKSRTGPNNANPQQRGGSVSESLKTMIDRGKSGEVFGFGPAPVLGGNGNAKRVTTDRVLPPRRCN